MSGCSISIKNELKLKELCKRVGGVPQKAVTKAASKGLTVVRRSVRSKVPVKTGALKKGLQRKAERSRVKGKKVYELRMNPSMNDTFQKPIKRPGLYGGKHNSHGYYPNSQEYGFLTRRKGGKGLEYVYGRRESSWDVEHGTYANRDVTLRKTTRHGNRLLTEKVKGFESQKVPGKRYFKRGAEQAESETKTVIIDTVMKEVEKEWLKKD